MTDQKEISQLDRFKQSSIFSDIFCPLLNSDKLFFGNKAVYVTPLASDLNKDTSFKNIRNLIAFYDQLESKELWDIMEITLNFHFHDSNFKHLESNAIMLSFFRSDDPKSALVYRTEYDRIDDYFSNEPNTIQASFSKLIKHINERTDLYPEHLTDEQKIWSIYFKTHPLVPSHFSAIDLATNSDSRHLLSMIEV